MVAKLLRTKTTLEDNWWVRDTESQNCDTTYHYRPFIPGAAWCHIPWLTRILSTGRDFSSAHTFPETTHPPSSRSSQSSTTRISWKGSALSGRRESRMDLMGPHCEQRPWQPNRKGPPRETNTKNSGEEVLEMQEEGQRNTARGVRRQREKHTSHPWKVQHPSCPKANCNLYKKIPHLKSFEHFPTPEEDFSFWGRALGLRAWALIFQCFLKTAQGKNTFQGLASIYSTQNHKIAMPATEFPGCLNGQILCPHPNFIFHT